MNDKSFIDSGHAHLPPLPPARCLFMTCPRDEWSEGGGAACENIGQNPSKWPPSWPNTLMRQGRLTFSMHRWQRLMLRSWRWRTLDLWRVALIRAHSALTNNLEASRVLSSLCAGTRSCQDNHRISRACLSTPFLYALLLSGSFACAALCRYLLVSRACLLY